jgi:hypothetical protein
LSNTLDLRSSLDGKGQISTITETNNKTITYTIYTYKSIFTREDIIYIYIYTDVPEEITASILRVLKLQEYVQIGTETHEVLIP